MDNDRVPLGISRRERSHEVSERWLWPGRT